MTAVLQWGLSPPPAAAGDPLDKAAPPNAGGAMTESGMTTWLQSWALESSAPTEYFLSLQYSLVVTCVSHAL